MNDTISVRTARRRLPELALLLLACLPIVANAAVAVISARDLHLANVQAAYSHEAMAALKAVEDVAERRARAHRDYRMSGDAQYLEAFRRSSLSCRLYSRGCAGCWRTRRHSRVDLSDWHRWSNAMAPR